MAISDFETALVTGASSGVGEAVVRALRAKGLETCATARPADRLKQLAEAIVYARETPWHVNVATIELWPVEQATAGVAYKALDRGGQS